MRRRLSAVLGLVVLVTACSRVHVDNPNAPTATPTPTPTPAVVTDRIEFRVFGSNLFGPAVIKHIDPANGLTLTTATPPYFVAVTNTDPDAFVYLEASAFGFTTSTLQVQIFVNGKLFREAASVGSSLFASAGGTVRH